MWWSQFRHLFKKDFIQDTKGLAFVYVISAGKGKGPYKIGITTSDLYRRFGNYQTSFVDFDILYLIIMPYIKERVLEKILHNDVELKKTRIQFPTPDGQPIKYSEWFGEISESLKRREDNIYHKAKYLDSKTIFYAIRRAFREHQNIESLAGYDLTHNNQIVNLLEFQGDKYDDNFGLYVSKSGTIHTLSKQGANQYNVIYFDNSRKFQGINFEMSEKSKPRKKKK